VKITPLGLALFLVLIHIALNFNKMDLALLVGEDQIGAEQAAIQQRDLRRDRVDRVARLRAAYRRLAG
jgi:hypothetical protein